MIKVFILTAKLSAGFTMMPYSTEVACYDAMVTLPLAVVRSAECYPIEMIASSGSRLAPEMAPLPPRKPGRNA